MRTIPSYVVGAVVAAFLVSLPLVSQAAEEFDPKTVTTNKALVAFLKEHYIPYVQDETKLMEALTSADQQVTDIGLQDLLKQAKALTEATEQFEASGKISDSMEHMKFLVLQNTSISKMRGVALDSLFGAYVLLGKKAVLPPESLKMWREMEMALNGMVTTNLGVLQQLAVKLPKNVTQPQAAPKDKKENKPSAEGNKKS